MPIPAWVIYFSYATPVVIMTNAFIERHSLERRYAAAILINSSLILLRCVESYVQQIIHCVPLAVMFAADIILCMYILSDEDING